MNECLKNIKHASLVENIENNKNVTSDHTDYLNVLKKEVVSVLAGYEQLLVNNDHGFFFFFEELITLFYCENNFYS